MATVCDRIGFEDVMQGFEFFMQDATEDNPLYYSVWNGQKLKHISKHDDPAAAIAEFKTLLEVWQRNDTGGMLEARFHEKRPNMALNNKSEYVGSMTFKLRPEWQPAPGNMPVNAQPGQYQQPVNPMAGFLEQYQTFLQLQLLLQPTGAAVGADADKTVWDRIEGLLTTPIVEDIIKGAAEKIGLDMSHYKRGENNYQMAGEINTQDVASMDDLKEDDALRLRRALERLMVNEPDFAGLMEKLADLKEKSPGKYNMAKMLL